MLGVPSSEPQIHGDPTFSDSFIIRDDINKIQFNISNLT